MPADVGVRWREPFDGGRSITAYQVDGGEGNTAVTSQIVNGSTLEATFTNVPDGLHFFRARAQNSIGWGPWSDGILVNINIGDLVAIRDATLSTARNIGIFSISGANLSRAEDVKTFRPSTSTRDQGDMEFIGNGNIAAKSHNNIVVFNSATEVGKVADAIKIIGIPTSRRISSIQSESLTYLGNNLVACIDNTSASTPVIFIFSIGIPDGQIATEAKNVIFSRSTYGNPTYFMTYLGNNTMALYVNSDGMVHIVDISVSSGNEVIRRKSITMTNINSGLSGMTYIGNDEIAFLRDRGSYSEVDIRSIAGPDGSSALATRVIRTPFIPVGFDPSLRTENQRNRSNPNGIAYLSNIHGF